jgi:hypothetical protein
MSPKRPKKRRLFAREENPHKIFRKMTTDHADVLQNIEFILVEAYRENEDVDDPVVASVLKAAIIDQRPAGELTGMIFDRLDAIREQRDDVSDEIWTSGLKVVLESVRTHSDMQAGDTGYLDFVSPYVP